MSDHSSLHLLAHHVSPWLWFLSSWCSALSLFTGVRPQGRRRSQSSPFGIAVLRYRRQPHPDIWHRVSTLFCSCSKFLCLGFGIRCVAHTACCLYNDGYGSGYGIKNFHIVWTSVTNTVHPWTKTNTCKWFSQNNWRYSPEFRLSSCILCSPDHP